MTDFGNGVYGLGVFNQNKDGAWRGARQAIGNGGWDQGGYSSALLRPSSEARFVKRDDNLLREGRQRMQGTTDG